VGVKVAITVIDGPEKGKSVEFDEGKILVGRSRGEIRLSDRKISGQHCQFVIDGESVYLEDLRSTNGTFLGSQKVEERIELNNLDVVTVGLSRLSISIVEQLSDFKKANTPISEVETIAKPNAPESSPQPKSNPAKATSKAVDTELPPEGAEYRDTGIQRIDNLINDEMSAFSKWDHPAMSDNQEATGGIPKIQVVLVARKAPEGVSQVNCVGKLTTIGRKDVDVRVNDLDLSRKHAAIEIVGGTKAFVRDLASTNGTFVNGSKISYQELKAGDLIQIGQSVFEVQIVSV